MIDQNQILCAYLSASGVDPNKYKNSVCANRKYEPDNIQRYNGEKINKTVINKIEDELGIDLEFLKLKMTDKHRENGSDET